MNGNHTTAMTSIGCIHLTVNYYSEHFIYKWSLMYKQLNFYGLYYYSILDLRKNAWNSLKRR